MNTFYSKNSKLHNVNNTPTPDINTHTSQNTNTPNGTDNPKKDENPDHKDKNNDKISDLYANTAEKNSDFLNKSTTAVIEMLLCERKAQEEEIKRLSNVVNEIVNKSDKKCLKMRPESLLNEISAISPIMTSQSTYKKVDDERKIPKCVGGFQ